MATGDKHPVLMEAEKAQPGGVATLGENGRLVPGQAPTAGEVMTADGQSVEAAMSNKENKQWMPDDWKTSAAPPSEYPIGTTIFWSNAQWHELLNAMVVTEKRTDIATMQRIWCYGQTYTYYRIADQSGAWMPWAQFSTAADLAGKAAIEQGAWSPEYAGQGQSIVLQPPPELPEEKRFPVKIRTFFDQRGDAYLQIILGARWAYLPLSNLVAGSGAQIATATPPQEYDLPLAEGMTSVGNSLYFKTQDGVVTVNARVESAQAVNAGTAISTLPAGYRPARQRYTTVAVSGVLYEAMVNTDGTIVIPWTTIPENTIVLLSPLSFVAA